jgi:hypothetical protein
MTAAMTEFVSVAGRGIIFTSVFASSLSYKLFQINRLRWLTPMAVLVARRLLLAGQTDAAQNNGGVVIR